MKIFYFMLLVAYVDYSATITSTKTDCNLKFAVIIFRHGDRAPFFSYKTNPHNEAFPEGPFQLTKIGKQHMYKKGQILRKLYDGFLNKLYLDSEIYTTTTTASRAHMSAQMVLAGLYPPTSYLKWSEDETVWTPIPVYGGSPDRSDGRMSDCPAFLSVRDKALNFNDPNLDKMLPYISEKCGQNIESKHLFRLYDLLKCQIAAGLNLPDWMTPQMFAEIHASFESRQKFELFQNKRLQNMTTGPLLREIAQKLQENSNAEVNCAVNKKMILYSGHDFSIGYVAAILDNAIAPPNFGGSLHFHVYYIDDSVGYVVKLFYFESWEDDQGIELPLLNCGDPCTVDNFKKFVDSKLPISWEDDCNDI